MVNCTAASALAENTQTLYHHRSAITCLLAACKLWAALLCKTWILTRRGTSHGSSQVLGRCAGMPACSSAAAGITVLAPGKVQPSDVATQLQPLQHAVHRHTRCGCVSRQIQKHRKLIFSPLPPASHGLVCHWPGQQHPSPLPLTQAHLCG